jgi:hypothetical protein
MLMCAASVALGAAGVLAQAAPNFAGKWTLVPDATAPQGGGRGGGFGGLGTAATIVQDDKTLTITRTTQAGELTSVYNLDGSDSRNTLNFNGNAFEQTSKVTRDGSALVITTTADFGGNVFETSMKLALDASGTLTLESTRPDFQGGGAPIVTKATYKKN